MNKPIKNTRHTGLAAALSVMILWALSLTAGLTIDFQGATTFLFVPICLTVTFLYTGLFITAHDAMHGVVAPSSKRLNDLIGTLCTTAFALFSFTKLESKHWNHHRDPASPQDPDYHDGQHSGFLRWYLHFMLQYVTWKQVLGMAVVFNILKYALGIPAFNLTVMWVLPNMLSTLQLFYFGTYLPHRDLGHGYDNVHRARSNDFPVWLSFLTCYHFGYHLEHHQFPHIPWWQLPQVRKATLFQ